MIEGGLPGGSARYHAGQRRATADRLTLEANWLETIAVDQATMREALIKLPVAYAVLHDLNVPGSKGTIDHVVVGPGGAFIVVSRRYGEHIDFRDGQLWAGDRSMRSVLDGARGEAELMTQSLQTPVLPVLALLDTILPAATPGTIDGVLVTSADNVVRVITRGAHTLLGPDKVADITSRAMPMLHSQGSVPRTDPATGAPVPPAIERGMRLPTPDPMAGQVAPRPVGPPVGPPLALAPAVTTAATAPAAPFTHLAAPVEPERLIATALAKPHRQRRSAWSFAALIVALCLVAVAIGSLAALVWNNDDSDSPSSTAPATSIATTDSPTTETVAATSTDVSTTVAPTAPPTTAVSNGLPAPLVQYTPVCPAPGAGWELVPTWPGDIANLREYDVEMLITDSWVSLAGWKNVAQETSATLHGQPANASYMIRMTAVLTDGSRSANTPTQIVAPATPC